MGTFEGLGARVAEIADRAMEAWQGDAAATLDRGKLDGLASPREAFQGPRGWDTTPQGMAVAVVNAVMHATRGYTDGDLARAVETFDGWGGRVNGFSRDLVAALAGLREAMVNDAAMRRADDAADRDADDADEDGGPLDMADAAENYRGGVRIR